MALAATGDISTVAGTGTAGVSGDGGAATSAKLNFPIGVAVDSSGNIFIADSQNHRIRKVDTSGNLSTVAGTTIGFSGDGGAATSAQLFPPLSVAVDTSGNLFIADRGNNPIRKVDTSGNISTVAGSGTGGAFSGDGGLATSARLNFPTGVAVDASGNLFIADRSNDRIRKVDTSGNISTVAGTGLSSVLQEPQGVAVDPSGNIFIADTSNHRIRKVDTSGNISTVVGTGTQGFGGDGGAATSAQLHTPAEVAVDPSGNLFIADHTNHRIRKVETVAAAVPTPTPTPTATPTPTPTATPVPVVLEDIVLVKDINPTSNPTGEDDDEADGPEHLTNVVGTLFFTTDDGTTGIELWKSDGTAAGTLLVKDINPGAASANPGSLTNVAGTLFFGTDDGTTAGTVLVKDINPGASGSSVGRILNVAGTLFFSAIDGTTGRELWKSDGETRLADQRPSVRRKVAPVNTEGPRAVVDPRIAESGLQVYGVEEYVEETPCCRLCDGHRRHYVQNLDNGRRLSAAIRIAGLNRHRVVSWPVDAEKGYLDAWGLKAAVVVKVPGKGYRIALLIG